MESMTIIDAGQSEKKFIEFYMRPSISNTQQLLDILPTTCFKNLESRTHFINLITEFEQFPLFSMFEKLSVDLGLELDKKDKLSVFALRHITKKSEKFSQFADWAILRAYKRNPKWSLLAGRIKLMELYLTSCKNFSDLPLVIPKWFSVEAKEFIFSNKEWIDDMIVNERDLTFNFILSH